MNGLNLSLIRVDLLLDPGAHNLNFIAHSSNSQWLSNRCTEQSIHKLSIFDRSCLIPESIEYT